MAVDDLIQFPIITCYSPFLRLARLGRLAYHMYSAGRLRLSAKDPASVLHLLDLCRNYLQHVMALLPELRRRGLTSLFNVDAHAVLHVELARIEDVLVITGRFGAAAIAQGVVSYCRGGYCPMGLRMRIGLAPDSDSQA